MILDILLYSKQTHFFQTGPSSPLQCKDNQNTNTGLQRCGEVLQMWKPWSFMAALFSRCSWSCCFSQILIFNASGRRLHSILSTYQFPHDQGDNFFSQNASQNIPEGLKPVSWSKPYWLSSILTVTPAVDNLKVNKDDQPSWHQRQRINLETIQKLFDSLDLKFTSVTDLNALVHVSMDFFKVDCQLIHFMLYPTFSV